MKYIRNLVIIVAVAVAMIVAMIAIDPALLGDGTAKLTTPLPGSSIDNQMATTTNSAIPPGAPIGGTFQLTNQLGQPVHDTTYRGKYMLVFFGYSHCPDECPLTLQKMGLAMNALGPLARHVAPIFITIDPARDTPAVLRAYLPKFGPSLIGFTGSGAQIAGVAHEYAVAFDKNDPAASGANVIGHSTYIYLIGPDGKFLNLFPFTISVAQLTSVLQAQIIP